MVIGGRGSTRFGQESVKGVVDFEDPEMLEIFLDAVNREDFFDKFLPPTTLVRRVIRPAYRP